MGHPGNWELRHVIRRHMVPGDPFMALRLRGKGPLSSYREEGVRRPVPHGSLDLPLHLAEDLDVFFREDRVRRRGWRG